MGGVYIGVDESNHGGTDRDEIIVATFSLFPSDGAIMAHPNRRDYFQALNWIKNGKGEYRYTTVSRELSDPKSNIPKVLPFLVYDWIVNGGSLRRYLDMGNSLDILYLNIDGEVQSCMEHAVRQNLTHKLDDLFYKNNHQTFPLLNRSLNRNLAYKSVIQGFTKKQRMPDGHQIKRPICPLVVWMADVLANMIYKSEEDLHLRDPYRVQINFSN